MHDKISSKVSTISQNLRFELVVDNRLLQKSSTST